MKSNFKTYRFSKGARRGVGVFLAAAFFIAAGFAYGGTQPGAAQGEGLLQRDTLFGDLWGARPWLASHGINLGAVEYVDPAYVAAGGLRQGAAFAGLLNPSIGFDLGRLAGLSGFKLFVSAWIPEGTYQPTVNLVGSFLPLSFIEAPPEAKLADAYLRYRSPGGAVRLKIGKFGLDEDFDQNPAAATLLDANYTYRDIMANNLPGGGPAFPFEGPGAMIAVRPLTHLELLAGVFSGDPAGLPATAAAESLEPNGLAFPLNAGVLTIGEIDLSYDPPVGPGKLLIGGLYDSLSLPDLQTGAPVADEYMGYAGLTQTLWQKPTEGRSLLVFARVAYAPPAQNIITFDAQAGITLNGPFASRPDDSVALAASYDRMSSLAGGLSFESGLELAYGLQLFPWLKLTPDVQYVIRPGGGAVNPYDPATTIPNALAFQIQAAASL